jgi:hypothetical protein
MTEKFDPYYKWLGIPPRDQPPHHYRLLGIELFETDRDVIDAAANRVMAYLKDLAAGDEAEYSQSLLNEVSRARICLLNKEKKKTYDKELRADLKSKGVVEPKAGKPAAKPPAKKRKEASEEDTKSLQPPPEEPWPKIRTDAMKPKAAADPVVFAEPDESDDERPTKRTRWGLIAAAAVGGFLLAALIVAGVYLFSGPGNDRLASAHNGGVQGGPHSPTTNGETPDAEDDPNSGTESDLETDPDSDLETDVETDPAPDSKAKTKPASDGDGGDPAGSEAKPKAKPDGSPASDAESDLPDWSSGFQDPDDGSSAGKPSTDETSDNGSAKPDDEPSTDGTADPKDPEPSPDDNMVAKVDVPDVDPPKKPVITEPPAKPKLQPFEDFPQVVLLPDLESADAMTPQVLGPIHCQPDDLCFIKLRGGEKASKGSQSFVMRNADGGLAERDWEVFLRDGESGPETKIAHLSINDQSQLDFQWQAEAKTLPLSAHLRNCAFSFNCGGESHVVALRDAAQVEGMTLELGKTSTDEHWKIDMPPDPAAVKIEITGVQGAKYTVQPTPVIEANKGEAWIELEDGGGLLSLKVETEMKRNVEVTVTPHLKTPDGKRQRFNPTVFGKLLNNGKMELARMQIRIQQMQQAVNQATGPLKRQMEQNLTQVQELQVQQQAALDKGLKLEEFVKNADGDLAVQFRVFYDADSSEVDLLRIGG